MNVCENLFVAMISTHLDLLRQANSGGRTGASKIQEFQAESRDDCIRWY